MDFDTYKMDGEYFGKTDIIFVNSSVLVYFIDRHTIDINEDTCFYVGASPLLSIYDDCDDAQFARSFRWSDALWAYRFQLGPHPTIKSLPRWSPCRLTQEWRPRGTSSWRRERCPDPRGCLSKQILTCRLHRCRMRSSRGPSFRLGRNNYLPLFLFRESYQGGKLVSRTRGSYASESFWILRAHKI